MSTLNEAKMTSLGDKLLEIENEKAKVEEAIEEAAGEKKVKIKRTSLKGSKNPKKG